MSAAGLDARLLVRRGTFVLDVALSVAPGETLALLGPNGSGKSTLLGALAGLVRVQSGSVTVAGRVLTRVSQGERGSVLAPERRRVGLLGQDPLLFPHLSALENVAFGPRAMGVGRAEALRTAAQWLDSVELDGFQRRKAGALSGGQQQRVAIARALAAQPDVLLLDEPMASLDVQTASLVRSLLRERIVQSGMTTILVTHDVVDALVLAERCAILQAGRIIDEGSTVQVLRAPKNSFIAALAGLNLVQGTAGDDGESLFAGARVLRGRFAGGLAPRNSEVSAVFRPAAVTVAIAPPTSVEGNAWPATISSLEPSSSGVRVIADDGVSVELSALTVAELGLAVGQSVWLVVDPSEVSLRPAAG